MTELYGESVFGHDHDNEAFRLDALARMYDPATFARLATIVRSGMRCADIGAGLGRVSGWLAEQGCKVTAVDQDIRLLTHLPKVFPTVFVFEGDITQDLNLGTFDVVHSRLLLMHLRDRVDVFHRLTEMVAPGGWLVLGEGVEATSMASPPRSPFRQLMDDHWRALENSIGTDRTWGLRYPELFREAGFVDINIELYQPSITPTSAAGHFFQLGLVHLRDRILSDGLIDEETFEAAVKAMREPGFADLGMSLVTSWARKPQ